MWITLAIYLLFLAGMLALTRHVELRPQRRKLVLLSTPALLYLIGALRRPLEDIRDALLLEILAFLALVWVWAANMAFLGAVGFTDSLAGAPSKLTGVRPDFRFASAALGEKDYERGIPLLEVELEKDWHSFEGLQLLANALAENNDIEGALAVLNHTRRNPALTPEQGEILDIESGNLRCRMHNQAGPAPKSRLKSKVLDRILKAEREAAKAPPKK